MIARRIFRDSKDDGGHLAIEADDEHALTVVGDDQVCAIALQRVQDCRARLRACKRPPVSGARIFLVISVADAGCGWGKLNGVADWQICDET